VNALDLAQALPPQFDPALMGLSSLRVVALFVAAPVFGHRAVSPRIRIALGLAVATVAGAPDAEQWVQGMPGGELAKAAMLEVVIGLSLGVAARFVFEGVGMVGEIMAMQGGLGAAVALDPTSEASSGALTAMLRTTAFLIFLAIDGHHILVRGIQASFLQLPLGGVELEAVRFLELFGLAAAIFEIGVRFAAPVMVAMFCANLSVGMLGRAMPQLNLITLQLPALVGVTLLIVGMVGSELTRGFAAQLGNWPIRVLKTFVVES